MKPQMKICLTTLTTIILAPISNTAIAHDHADITNHAFSSLEISCAEHVANYKSSVKDINNDVPFNGSLSISVKDGRCYFQSNSIPNHNFNDGKKSFRNDVSEQSYVTSVTATPKFSGSNTPLSLSYDNAIFLNGVKLDLLATDLLRGRKRAFRQRKDRLSRPT
ncbi:hypothetical protein ACLKMH_12235 [Psychromonas sp. KJ10-10]|uniref:hypothetical protein n=1 Tax=Psychromonas sp. KJ10-10 TaxID=3391823 RepID=UPI0039B50846